MVNKYDDAQELRILRSPDGTMSLVYISDGKTTTYAQISPRGAMTVLPQATEETTLPKWNQLPPINDILPKSNMTSDGKK